MSEPAPGAAAPRRRPLRALLDRRLRRPRISGTLRPPGARAVFTAGGAVIALVLVIVLSGDGLRRVGYNLTPIQAELGTLQPGQTGCQPEPLSSGTRAVVLHMAPATTGEVAVRIRIEGAGRYDGTGPTGGLVATGVEGALAHGPPPYPYDDGNYLTMCVINTGHVGLIALGAPTGADQFTISSPGVAGVPTPGRVRVDDLLSAQPVSLWRVLPLLPYRIEAATGSLLAPWLVGAGALLALVAVVGLLRGGEGPQRLRRDLVWVVALTFGTGALWAGITPLFQKTDEPAHFAYVQAVATLGHPPQILNDPNDLSGQEGCWLDVLGAQGYRFFATERPPWNPLYLSAYDKECGAQSNVFDGAQYQSTQPPAYYYMAAVAYDAASSAPLPTRVLAVRLFSVLLAAIAVLLTYLMVREVIPGSRWTARAAALALALQPIFMYNESGVNSDSLVVAVAAGIAFVAARAWRRGFSWRYALALGALTGLGVLSKLNFLTLIPSIALLALALCWHSYARGGWRDRALGLGRIAAGVAVAVGLYLLYIVVNNDVWHRAAAGTGASDAVGVAGPALNLRRLGDFVWQFFLPRLPDRPRLFPYYPLWNDILKAITTRLGWWNDFGFDSWAPWLVVLGIAIAVIAAVYVLPRARRRPWPLLIAVAAVLGFVVALVIADYQVLDAYGDGFEGRYVFPAMPIWGLTVACAVAALPARLRPAMTGLLASLFLAHTVIAICSTTSIYYL